MPSCVVSTEAAGRGGRRGTEGVSMMKKLAILAVAAAVLAGAFARGANSGGGPVLCNGTIDGGAYRGDVVVPPGAQCNLWNATVLGDVRAESGSTLNAVGDRV